MRISIKISFFLFIYFNIYSLDIVIYENPPIPHGESTIKTIEEHKRNLIEIKKYNPSCNIQCMLSESLYQSYLYYIETKNKKMKLDIYETQTGNRIYSIQEDLTANSFENLILKGNTLIRLYSYGVIDIFQAIDQNNEKMLKYFAKNKKNLKKTNGLYMTPLNYALYKKRYNLIKYLINDPSAVYIEDINRITSLHRFASSGNEKLFKKYYSDFFKPKDNQGNTFLHYALKSGNKNLINFLIKKGFSCKEKNIYEKNCLHFLAESGNKELFNEFLKKYPEQLTKITKTGRNILHFAVKSGNLEFYKYLMKLLKEKNFDIEKNQFDKLHRNYLFYSVDADKEGYIESIKNLNQKFTIDKDSNNMLHYAVLKSKINSIRDLIHLKIGSKEENKFKQTPLLLAFRYLNLDIIKEMITDLNFTDLKDENGLTPLHYSILGNKFDNLNYLIAGGIDINTTTKYGENALFFALLNRSESMFLYLYYRGVNPNIKMYENKNLLHVAAEEKNTWFFNFLINRNKKLYRKDYNNEYPLDIAIKNSNLNMVKNIYKKFPLEFYRPDKNNHRAIEKAVLLNKTKIVDFMLKNGIRTDIPDNNMNCVLDLAFITKNKYIISKLRKIGAYSCKDFY